MRQKIMLIYLVLSVLKMQAQDLKNLKGIVLADQLPVEGVHVINLSTEKSTVTKSDGTFSIEVKEDDLLTFSAVHLDYWRKSIRKADLEKGFVEINMTVKSIDLDNVEVTEYTQINAVSAGIIPKPVKKYTPAERRLKTAGDFKYWHLLNILGGNLPLDPIINKISGRTAMLKKELSIEKKELMIQSLDLIFDNSFYSELLEIPEEYVTGFKMYVVEFEEMDGLIKQKKEEVLTFYMLQLLEDFQKLYIKEP
jgi:hypothetical protein